MESGPLDCAGAPPSKTCTLASPEDSPLSHFDIPGSGEPLRGPLEPTGIIMPFAPISCRVPHTVHTPFGMRAPPQTPHDWDAMSTAALVFVATRTAPRS